MPTYEYRCKSCGHELEVVQAFTDDPLDTCPECEGALRKVYGNVGISFKGSGFYKNDARGSSKKTSTSSSSADSSSTASDTKSTSSDTKSTSTSTPTDKASSSTAASTSSD